MPPRVAFTRRLALSVLFEIKIDQLVLRPLLHSIRDVEKFLVLLKLEYFLTKIRAIVYIIITLLIRSFENGIYCRILFHLLY